MSGADQKGALVSFTPAGGALGMAAIPNVIIFQFNPETITHTWTEATGHDSGNEPKINFSPVATAGVPGEAFSFTLMLDSDTQLADWGADPTAALLAEAGGIHAQLSSLELLQFPASATGGGLVGQVSAATDAAAQGATKCNATAVPVSETPIVLFVWGAQRIVPVRVSSLNVSETLFDSRLNPTHATAQITLTVLTPEELTAVQSPMSKLARAAYRYNQGLREARAAANLATSAESILGMLPTPF